jgi:hypothetical protein
MDIFYLNFYLKLKKQAYITVKHLILLQHKSAILNLGYALTWGYASSLKGVSRILNHIKIRPQKVNKRSDGGMPRGSILIWGCAKRFNIDLGVCELQKFENPYHKSSPSTIKE